MIRLRPLVRKRWSSPNAVATRERQPGTVPDEPLDTRSVLALDARGSVDAEPTGALPGERAGSVGFVHEVGPTFGGCPTQVAGDASLEDRFQQADVIGRQLEGLVKADLAGGGLCEHTSEHDEVVVRVGVEGRAEPMKEPDGSELGVAGCSGFLGLATLLLM